MEYIYSDFIILTTISWQKLYLFVVKDTEINSLVYSTETLTNKRAKRVTTWVSRNSYLWHRKRENLCTEVRVTNRVVSKSVFESLPCIWEEILQVHRTLPTWCLTRIHIHFVPYSLSYWLNEWLWSEPSYFGEWKEIKMSPY